MHISFDCWMLIINSLSFSIYLEFFCGNNSAHRYFTWIIEGFSQPYCVKEIRFSNPLQTTIHSKCKSKCNMPRIIPIYFECPIDNFWDFLFYTVYSLLNHFQRADRTCASYCSTGRIDKKIGYPLLKNQFPTSGLARYSRIVPEQVLIKRDVKQPTCCVFDGSNYLSILYQ